MTERISTLDMRQRLGDMLNRVALRHDEFVIERKGKALAALVSVERLEQMRRMARQTGLAFLNGQAEVRLSDGQATELSVTAKAWARANKKPKAKRK